MSKRYPFGGFLPAIPADWEGPVVVSTLTGITNFLQSPQSKIRVSIQEKGRSCWTTLSRPNK
jgi:hypothetical protein